MSRFTKIALIFVLIVVLTAIALIAADFIQNWTLERQVRHAFAVTGKHISAEEIQAHLDRRFPIGTPRRDIERFLTEQFKRTDHSILTSAPHGKTLSYMVDCGSRHLGTRDRILLEFIFQTDGDLLQEIRVQDKSIAL